MKTLKIPLLFFILFSLLLNDQAIYAQANFEDYKISKDRIDIDSLVLDKVQEIGVYYSSNQFELGFSMTNDLYFNEYNESSLKIKEIILSYAIKLSFALDLRDSTTFYMENYYKLTPSFSEMTIQNIIPPLKEYIYNFLKSKNQVSVYVNKFAQSIDFISSTVTVYDQDDFKRLGARDLLDVIRMTPGFAEIGDWNERQFGTRGTSNSTLQDVLILINGHRISDNLTSSNGPDWISLDYIKQMEVVRGPGSAIYGGNAFSGVVNIVTKAGSGEKINEAKMTLGNGNNLTNLGGDFSNAYKFNYQYGTQINNTESIYFSATYNQSAGSEINYSDAENKIVIPDNSRTVDTTGVEYINAYGPGYNFLMNYRNRSTTITANAQSNNYYLPRSLNQNLWQTQDLDTIQALRRRIDRREFIQLQSDLLNTAKFENSSLMLKVSGDHFYKDLSIPTLSVGNVANSPLVGDEYRATVNLEFSTKSLTLGPNNLPNFLLVGAEWYVNKWGYRYYRQLDTANYFSSLIDDSSFDFTTGTIEGDRKENFAAFYIQDEMQLIPNKLVLSTNIRFNYDEVFSNFKNGLQWGKQYSPRISLIYIAKKDLVKSKFTRFKVIYNSAFLPAAFLYRSGFVPAFQTPNDGQDALNAQIIESLEGGVFLRLDKHLDYNFQAYVNFIDDNIVQNANNKYVNESNPTRINGFENEFKYRAKSSSNYQNGFNFHLFSNYSYSRTHISGDSLAVFMNVFNAKIWNDTTTRYPINILKFGGDLSYKKSETIGGSDRYSKIVKSQTKYEITFGANAQLISDSHRYSPYFLNQGSIVNNTDKEWIEVPSLLLINANIHAIVGKFNFGIQVYNLTDKEGFMTSADTRLGMKRQEGRMFYFSLGYAF